MLKGVLEGIRDILVEGIVAVEKKPSTDNPVAIPYMKSAKSMLDGVIREFKEESGQATIEIPLPEKEKGLDLEARAAKEELT